VGTTSATLRTVCVPAALTALLALAACETPTVATPAIDAQAAPATAPPQLIGEPGAEGAPPPGAPPVARPDVDRLRIAILVPLSGRNAGLGRDMLDAAQMALFDAGTRDMALMPRDTRGTPDGAQAAARAAVDDGAELIIGPLLSPSVAAAAPTARSRGVPLVAFTNDRAVAGNGVWPMGFVPQEQVRRVVAFARAQGVAEFAALAPTSPYGDAMVAALQEATVLSGAQLTRVAFYPPGDTEATTEVVKALADYDNRRTALMDQRELLEGRDDQVSQRALKRLERRDTLGEVTFQAVLLPTAGDELMQLAPLLPYYDIDPARVRFLGTWQWDVTGIGTEPALMGAWFAAPPRETRIDFEARFKALYGRLPNRLATLAYDAMALAAVIARQTDGETRRPRTTYDAATLTQPSGFLGVDGIFRLLPSGEVQRGLAILEIERDGFRTVDPAPKTFEAFGS